MKAISKKTPSKCTEIRRFLRSVDALYHWIGLGSLAVMLVKVLILNGIPAPVRVMSAVSPVVEGILGSVIASYIFYLFCIHPPVYSEKKASAAFVHFILIRVKKNFEEHLSKIPPSLSYDSTAEDFYQAFTGISPFGRTAPLILQAFPQMIYADWFQYFQNENVRIQKEVSRLMDSRLTLDTDLTYTLNLINDCSWFSVIDHLTSMKGQLASNTNPFVNPGLPGSSCSATMYELKELIRKLQPAIDAAEKLTGRV